MTHRTRGGWRRRVAIALSLAVATTVCAVQVAQAAPAAPAAPVGAAAVPQPRDKVQRASIDRLPSATLQRLATARLANPTQAKSPRTLNAPAKQPVDPIDMRVLVLATTGDPNPNGVNAVPAGSWDWDLSTLTSALDYIGVPYDV